MDAPRLTDGGVYVDATFGGGGYSREMLGRANCRVIAFDRDPDADCARGPTPQEPQAKGKFTLHQGRFGDLSLDEPVDGVVFDLACPRSSSTRPNGGSRFRRTRISTCGWRKDGPSAADAVNWPQRSRAR